MDMLHPCTRDNSPTREMSELGLQIICMCYAWISFCYPSLSFLNSLPDLNLKNAEE